MMSINSECGLPMHEEDYSLFPKQFYKHSTKTKDSVPRFPYNTDKSIFLIKTQSTCPWAPHQEVLTNVRSLTLFTVSADEHVHFIFPIPATPIISPSQECNSDLSIPSRSSLSLISTSSPPANLNWFYAQNV